MHERLHSGAGLADPGPIASALWVDTELHSSVCLDSIVTVVDAHNLKKQLQESGSHDGANEAERQIAFADTILLNKVRPTKLSIQNQSNLLSTNSLSGGSVAQPLHKLAEGSICASILLTFQQVIPLPRRHCRLVTWQ